MLTRLGPFKQRDWFLAILASTTTRHRHGTSLLILLAVSLLYTPTEHSILSQRLPFVARRSTTKITMSKQIFIILAACLAVTMAVPTQDRAVQAVTGGINQFSSAFFQEVGKGKSGNLITSPLSASIALSMTAYGARGETEKEFKRVLHLPEESVARTGYANFIDSLNAVKNVELRLANKVYVNTHFKVKPTFEELTQTAFRSTSETLNFGNNVQAADTINQWCEEQTNHRIKDLVKSDQLNAATAMVLVNAVYFKGNWASKFDQALTKNKPFHVTKNQVKEVPTMHKVGQFKYGVLPELKARFVVLPYKGDELSMVIVLPDEVDGLAQVEKKLVNLDLNELIKNGYKTEVSLDLPKFRIESTIDLNQHLMNMGLVKAFDQTNADFSGISDTGVFISSVIQKAFIEVNEEGSEAAGATAVLVTFTSALVEPSPPPVFNVDRPFYYSIVKMKNEDEDESPWGSFKPKEVEATLFTGHVTEPKI